MEQLFIKRGNGYKQLITKGDGGLFIKSNNPLDFEFGQAAKTYSITILNVGDNNIILDNIFFKNGEHSKMFESYYKVDDVWFEGILKVLSLNRFQLKAQFISTIGVIWDALVEKHINELDWDVNYEHLQTPTNIVNGIGGGVIRYDYCLRGVACDENSRQMVFDGGVLGRNKFLNRNMWDSSGNGVAFQGEALDFVDYGSMISGDGSSRDMVIRKPAFRVKEIINEIFKGYSVEQNLFTEEEYNNLYLLYSRKNKRNTPNWASTAKVMGYREIDDDRVLSVNTIILPSTTRTFYMTKLMNPDTLEGNLTPTVQYYQYEIPETGAYKVYGLIYLRAVFIAGGGLTNRNYKVRVREYTAGGTLVRTIYDKTINQNFIPNVEVFEHSFDTKVFEATGGNVIRYEVTMSVSNTTGSNISFIASYESQPFNYNVDGAGSEVREINNVFGIDTYEDFGIGALRNAQNILPEMKVKDFMRSILTNFNAEIFISQLRKEIKIINRTNYSPNHYDLTPFILENEYDVSELVPEYRYELGYKSDNNDDYGKLLSNEGVENGQGIINDNKSLETVELNVDMTYNFYQDDKRSEFYSILSQYLDIIRIDGNKKINYNTIERLFELDANNVLVFTGYTTIKKEAYREINDVIPRLAFYNGNVQHPNGSDLLVGFVNYQSTGNYTVPYFTNYYVPTKKHLSFSNINKISTHNQNYDGSYIGLITNYFNNVEQNNGKTVKIKVNLLINNKQLSALYNLLGFDMRALFFIGISGIKGYYQLVNLEQIDNNIFSATLISRITEQVGEFNNDFNNDFNI